MARAFQFWLLVFSTPLHLSLLLAACGCQSVSMGELESPGYWQIMRKIQKFL